MVRTYIRKTERRKLRKELILQAIRQIKYERKSIRETSEVFEIPLRSLQSTDNNKKSKIKKSDSLKTKPAEKNRFQTKMKIGQKMR